MTTAAAISARAGDAANTTNAAPAPPRDVSIVIVKASQREHVISRLWPEFVKSQRLKHADPTRASTAALSLFVARLLAGEVGGSDEGSGEGGGGNNRAAAAEAAKRLARRHLDVAEQLAAEKKADKAEAPKATVAGVAAGEEGAPTDGGGGGPSSSTSLAAAVRSLVAATLAHPRSKELYGSFPVTSRGWRRLPRVYHGSGEGTAVAAGAADGAAAAAGPSSSPSATLPPALVAIDCEMVETEGGKETTDLARVAVAASIPLCWFEDEEEEGEEEGEPKAEKDDGKNKEEEEEAAQNGAPCPSPPPPPPPPPKQLTPVEAAALSLRRAGYGPPHLVLSAAVAPPAHRKVSDWRRHVTGLSRCSLAAAPMGRAEAQRAVIAAVARASGWRGEGGGGGGARSPSASPEPEEPAPAASSHRPQPPPPPAPAVLVGHALHHDLRALRLDAASGNLVIDTALLFGYEGLPRATPGLADLYAAVVGKGRNGGGSGKNSGAASGAADDAAAVEVAPLRSPGAPHDCAADAVAALALAAEALAARVGGGGGAAAGEKGGGAGAGRITVPAPARKVERDELCRLLVHGLRPPPPSSSSAAPFDAAAAVAALFETMPAGVARPRLVEAVAAAAAENKEAATAATTKPAAAAAVATKAWAVFASPAEADAAFAALPLPNPGSPASASVATDSLGRPQRLARIPAGAADGEAGPRSSLPNPSNSVSVPSQVVRVRKAAAHAGLSHGRFKPAKRDRSAASVRHGREQKKMRGKSG